MSHAGPEKTEGSEGMIVMVAKSTMMASIVNGKMNGAEERKVCISREGEQKQSAHVWHESSAKNHVRALRGPTRQRLTGPQPELVEHRRDSLAKPRLARVSQLTERQRGRKREREDSYCAHPP